jgi:O-antigen/teichoic acid export membrane protein
MRARRLSVRALWGLASWALPLAVAFVVTPPLLRTLGAERFGVLMIILVTPLVAGQLELGITSSGVRRLASTLASGKVDLRTLATLSAALATIGGALGALIWFAAEPASRWLGFAAVLGDAQAVHVVRWCAVWAAVSLLTAMPGLLARSAQALVWIAAVQTVATALLWLSALALARAGHPLSAVAALGIAISVVSACATAVAMRRLVDWSGALSIDLAILSADRRFSAGMFATQVASTIVYQGDRMLISALASPAAAGMYALCANLANKTLAATVALTSFAFPHAAGLQATGDRERLQALVHTLDRSVAVVVMPVLLPGWFLATPFLALWLGSFASNELATVFRLLWLAFLVPAFAIPVGSLLAADGNSALPARFSWLTVVVVLGSIFVFVPQWGALGGAIAMVLGMSTSLLFRFVARRTVKLKPAPGRARFWAGVAVGLGGQLVVLLLSYGRLTTWWQVLSVAAAALAVFYGLRAIFRLLSPEEEQLLQRLISRQWRAGKL